MGGTYHDEYQVALAAVRRAGRACRAVQRQLVGPDTIQKKDRSPVTVADYASQAVICAELARAFPGDIVVGEEQTTLLRDPAHAAQCELVVRLVAQAMDQPLSAATVLDWIDRGTATPGATGRFWTVDPIDGTKGFLRCEQYAVALALIEDGRVVLGALACPNLDGEGKGVVLLARRGGGAGSLPMDDASGPEQAQPVRVSALTEASRARFCESVESGHSDQGRSRAIAQALGITAPAVRMDSQAKYAAVARGDAQIYLRLPTSAEYRENIWDHAAGAIIVEQAGGAVTDLAGRPLDFSRGRTLTANRGIVATNGPFHAQVLAAVTQTVGA